MRRVWIIMMCAAVVLPASAWATRRSTEALSESLQGFEQSIAKLQDANSRLSDYNRDLKAHIQQGKNTLKSLAQENEQLEKDAGLYASKTEKKSGELNTFEIQMNQIKGQLQKIDQDLDAKQQKLNAQLRRQQVIWTQMGLAKDKNAIDQLEERNVEASAAVIKDKMELNEDLRNAEDRIAGLEKEVAYQSLLRQDPQISLPKLASQRDELRQQLASLSSNADQAPPIDPNQIKKLKSEISELDKRRTQDTNLLQMLQAQYDKNQRMAKNVAEEKKLQDTIAALKKDNKSLKQQTADLRFEMVDLDKRKAHLENIVKSAR
jgi:chromosome segregation ATPase